MEATAFHPLKVKQIRRETPDAVSIVFDVPDDLRDAYRFEAGQYLTVRRDFAGEEVRRSYSVCSGLDDGELRIAIKRHEDGRFSSFANTVLKAGDAIEVMPPRGRFTAKARPEERHVYLMVAAGSGITPVLSILKTILNREPYSQAVLVYGNRDARAIMFRAELEDLKDTYLGRLTVLHVLSREHQDVGLLNGRIDGDKIAAILKSLPEGRVDAAYLCGPTPMMKTVREALEAAGLPRERIRTEIFTAQGAPAGASQTGTRRPAVQGAEAAAEARITLNGREVRVPMLQGETVLEAAVRAPLVSASVTPVIADTTTARRSQLAACSSTMFAAWAWASGLPTEVPPNFMANVVISSPPPLRKSSPVR